MRSSEDLTVENMTTLFPKLTNRTVPRELVFTEDSLVSVISYSLLFVLAGVGNVSVFAALIRNRRRRSRINTFVLHLCLADMMVAFIMLPMEIGWHITVSWKAGDVGCRIFMFFRTFGFYLSSCILVSISLDRYFAIAKPLNIHDANRRGKIMLLASWICSIGASIPQSVIFHLEQHPGYPWHFQCVTFNFFPTAAHQLAYNLFNMTLLYCFPLLAIVACYSLILFQMWGQHKEAEKSKGYSQTWSTSLMSRHCSNERIIKARVRTLKMTLVIVSVFILCWTPYFVICAWWWIDSNSAKKIDTKVQRGLLIFAVSNSCMNPIVYGMFTTIFRREANKLKSRLKSYLCPQNGSEQQRNYALKYRHRRYAGQPPPKGPVYVRNPHKYTQRTIMDLQYVKAGH